MKYIAHRGYKNNSKENTLKSFVNAINESFFKGFELDIRESKDKQLVVIHDAFIDRVTTDSGLVKNKTTKELNKLGIPTLEEVLKLKTDKLILIEIKDYEMNLKYLVKLLNRFKNKNIYVSSFSYKVINRLIRYNYTFKLGILTMIINKDRVYSKYDFVCLYKSILSNNIIKYFVDKKIKIFIWNFTGFIKLDNSYIHKDKLYLIVNDKL